MAPAVLPGPAALAADVRHGAVRSNRFSAVAVITLSASNALLIAVGIVSNQETRCQPAPLTDPVGHLQAELVLLLRMGMVLRQPILKVLPH